MGVEPLFYIVNDGDDIEFIGTNAGFNIQVASGATANITLNGANVRIITLQSGSNATVTLSGSNSLTNGISGITLTIKGGGSLETAGIAASSVIIEGGEVIVGGNITTYGGSVTVTGGKLDVTGDINSDLTISGGEVTVSGTISGATTHNGGTINGKPVGGFNVPKTGLPDLTLHTYLMFAFALLSVILWGYVIASSRQKESPRNRVF